MTKLYICSNAKNCDVERCEHIKPHKIICFSCDMDIDGGCLCDEVDDKPNLCTEEDECENTIVRCIPVFNDIVFLTKEDMLI